MLGQGCKCPRIISDLNSARYPGQRTKPSPQHIHNRRVLYISELVRVAKIENCIRCLTHPKTSLSEPTWSKPSSYPVPEGAEYEAPEAFNNDPPQRRRWRQPSSPPRHRPRQT